MQEKILDVVLNINDIMSLIPHRYPFLLVDKVKDIVLDESATGIKCVSMNEHFFLGHFPGHPVMPGVLIVEAFAQTASIHTLYCLNLGKTEAVSNIGYFMSIEEAKFRKPVGPGDVLELRVKREKQRGNVFRYKGQAFVDGVLTSEATFTIMIIDTKSESEK
jgi:3-hydroxyacyl-[acyl-carrier-protein] dehydratase